MTFKGALIACAAVLTAGCMSIPAPKEVAAAQTCDAPRYILEASPHDQKFLATTTPTLSQAVADKYRAAPSTFIEQQPVSASMLFLSGGSQNGAFGAGALEAWSAQRPGGLPRFRVVTGISTGSIMATHAFLNQTPAIATSYRISSEAEILKPYVRSRDLRGLRDIYKTVRKGAVAELTPMRALLPTRITDTMLEQVAAEAEHRSLLIGAVDVELGKAVIFDMTALAAQFANATDPNRRKVLRDCYFDIILASSSVPMAAPPTFIDNRMYIDGGARFGVVAAGLEDAALAVSGANLVHITNEVERPNIYVIINGDLDIEHSCTKVEPADCADPSQTAGAQKAWSLPNLAMRSVSILIDQIYRFSNERIHLLAQNSPFVSRTMRIDETLPTFSDSIAFAGEDNASRTCAAWKEIDKQKAAPVEFFPRYMHCLVKFGANRMAAKKWYCRDPLSSDVTADERATWLIKCREVHQQPRDWE